MRGAAAREATSVGKSCTRGGHYESTHPCSSPFPRHVEVATLVKTPRHGKVVVVVGKAPVVTASCKQTYTTVQRNNQRQQVDDSTSGEDLFITGLLLCVQQRQELLQRVEIITAGNPGARASWCEPYSPHVPSMT